VVLYWTKTAPKSGGIVMSKPYNSLRGRARAFAQSHRLKKAEWTERVKKGKCQKSNSGLAQNAGDGQYGFASRPKSQEGPVKIEVGMDGQYLKKRRSVARKQKNASRLVSTKVIAEATEHPQDKKVRLAREAASKAEAVKAERKSKRNRRAARLGRVKARKAAAVKQFFAVFG